MDFDDLVKKEKINLWDEDLSDGNIEILIEAVRKSDVLEELQLTGNRLTLADGKMAEAIACGQTLRVLILDYNKIAAEGAKRLADAIKVNETLQEIYLYNNKIGDEGAKSFADALAVNKPLRKMNLMENEIGNEGAKSFAALFETNRTLRKVDLDYNHITDEGALRLAEALKVNYIIKLDLGDIYSTNAISDQVREKIEAILNDKTRMHFQEIIASNDQENAALREALDAKDQELKNKEENFASLKAEHSASVKEFDSYKKSIQGALEQLNKAAMTVDLTGGDPGPSN